MISIARTFGAPDTVPAGSVARSTSIGPETVTEPPGHLRRQVHHVAVPLERHQLVDGDRAELGHPPDVVARQIDEHDVLGALLGMLHQLGRHEPVVLVGAPSATGPGDRARTRRSGRATAPSARATNPTIVNSGWRTKYMYGDGFTWRSTR